MSDIDLHHLSAAYALDALEHHEREAFEAHYESCDVCRADVLAFRETLTHVAGSLATPPPPSVKARVLAEIAVTRQLSPALATVVDLASARRNRRITIAIAAAAAVVMLVVGVVAIAGRGSSDRFSSDLAHLMEQPDTRMIDLPSTGTESGTFRVAWSPTLHQAALIGEHLPPAPAGKAYELWLLTPSRATAMQVLDPADGGHVRRVLSATDDPSGWAITLEPRSGSAVPTGEIIYAAQV